MLRLTLLGCVIFLAKPSASFLSTQRPIFVQRTFTAALRAGQERRRASGGARTTNKQQGGSRRPSKKEPEPRPILTIYENQRNPIVNDQRLNSPIGCEHFGTCPGCVVNSKIGEVDVIQSAKLYFSSTAVRKKRMDVAYDDLVVEAKLAVAPKSSAWAKDGCVFGLYARGTHSVLPIPNCEVHHPSINKAIAVLEAATAKVGTSTYEEDKQEGGLRYVQVQVERTTGKVCLTLIWNAEQIKQAQPGLSRLVKQLQSLDPNLWHSIWLHCNDNPGNAIFARSASRWCLLSGPEFIREPLPVGDKGWLYFTPLAFRQGNMDGFDVLATDVAKLIPGKSRLCELYAGVGLLGMTALAYHAKKGTPLVWVRCSDENPANPRCFQRTVDSL
jgi:23S rRNA (uracil1939-C5)-methyltransferase